MREEGTELCPLAICLGNDASAVQAPSGHTFGPLWQKSTKWVQFGTLIGQDFKLNRGSLNVFSSHLYRHMLNAYTLILEYTISIIFS